MQAARLVDAWLQKNPEEILRLRWFHMQFIEKNKPQRITKNPAGYFVNTMNGKIEFESGFDEWYDQQKRNRTLEIK